MAAYIINSFADSSAPVQSLWRPLAVALAAVLLWQSVVTVLTRRPHAAAITTLLLSLLLVDAPELLGVVALACLVTAIVRIRLRFRADLVWSPITGFLNPIAVVVVALAATAASAAVIPYAVARTSAPAEVPTDAPDVYVLMLDGHPRDDTAKEYFGLSTTMGERLRELGFAVLDDARSNYNMTILTMVSMMNMALVDDRSLLGDPPNDPPGQYRWLTKHLNEGRSITALHGLGYEFVTISSPFTNVAFSTADRLLEPSGLTYFELSLLQVGNLPHVAPDTQRSWAAAQHRDRILESLGMIEELVAEKAARPRFIFAHVMAPHPPPVFDAAGRDVDGWPCFPTRCTFWDGGQVHQDLHKRRSAAQIAHIDTIVAETVATILRKSVEPPIVIVMSDHGHRHDLDNRVEMAHPFFAWQDPAGKLQFPSGATPVNLIARLIESLTDGSMPLAPEQSYWVDMLQVSTNGIMALEPIDAR